MTKLYTVNIHAGEWEDTVEKTIFATTDFDKASDMLDRITDSIELFYVHGEQWAFRSPWSLTFTDYYTIIIVERDMDVATKKEKIVAGYTVWESFRREIVVSEEWFEGLDAVPHLNLPAEPAGWRPVYELWNCNLDQFRFRDRIWI